MDINDDQRNGELEDQFEDSPENSGDAKMASSSCSERSKRTTKKRVVSVPIREIEGFRMKGDHMSAPPSDSWAWRKYGQKPIKGSPYPRGYYRCSSSKVCPARKQVERSRVDPDMLMVTYSCEHNHPYPAPKNNNQNTSDHHSNTSTAAATTTEANATTLVPVEPAEVEEEKKPINHLNRPEKRSEEKVTSLVEVAQINASHEFVWLNDVESASCASLESSILREDKISTDKEMGVAFTEEEESLFADLGELPECSTVFRNGSMQSVEEQQQHSLAPWYGSTWDV